jgi:CheY-like chemotaxis protein
MLRALLAERGPDISYKAFAVGCSNSDWRLLGLCGDAALNGMQTVRRLKANEQTRAIPIVAVTAFGMSGDRGIILGGGYDDYMAKPVELTRFLKLVDRYTGQND